MIVSVRDEGGTARHRGEQREEEQREEEQREEEQREEEQREEDGGTGLTNEDFRRLVETSRQTTGNASKDNNEKRMGDVPTVPRREHVRNLRKVQDVSTWEEHEGEDQVKDDTYRDRAEERRRGTFDAGFHAHDDAHGEPMVKGLDYSLLKKAREEREEKRNTSIRKKADVVASASATKAAALKGLTKPKSPLAKSLELVLLQLAKNHDASNARCTSEGLSNINMGICTGRMSYVYNIKSNLDQQMPTVKMRAGKYLGARSTGHHDTNMGCLPPSLVQEISKIMQYTMHGGSLTQHDSARKEGKEVKKEQEQEEEEDIFGDVGTDYVPEKVVDTHGVLKKVATYFEPNVEHKKVPDDDSTKRAEVNSHVVVKEGEGRVAGVEKLSQLQQSDGYDECYPGYFDTGAMLEDSDDEGNEKLTNVAKGNVSKKQELKIEQAKEKAKIEHELSSIQKIFDEKGYEHNAAFQKKGRTKHSQDEPSMFKKKRRI